MCFSSLCPIHMGRIVSHVVVIHHPHLENILTLLGTRKLPWDFAIRDLHGCPTQPTPACSLSVFPIPIQRPSLPCRALKLHAGLLAPGLGGQEGSSKTKQKGMCGHIPSNLAWFN